MITESIITYADAIKQATEQSLATDPTVFVIGLGVPDPKGIFGTTKGLHKKFPDQLFDMPCSENAMTGICIGAAINGMRPILTHQRMDFAMLTMEQVANQAAKWHFMFAGKMKCPMVIRMIVGRGWGQGPQHSQNIQAWFAHIPGLKVVAPATARDAKGLLMSSIKDNNPVIFIEHRWLHSIKDNVPDAPYEIEIGKANVLKQGTDISIISNGYMTVEAVKAYDHLSKQNISIEVIDLRTIAPLDEQTIFNSVKKTTKVLVLDECQPTCGVSADVIARLSENNALFQTLSHSPQRVTLSPYPIPTSHALSKESYPTVFTIVKKIKEMMTLPLTDQDYALTNQNEKSDVPDSSFKGPF